MLTIKAPIELKTRNFHLRDDGGFHERIRGDYALMGSGLSSATLTHLLHTPPQLLFMEGDQTDIYNRTDIYAFREEHRTLVSNMINRILLSNRVGLTFQDRVYITDILHRLGIRDERRFMEQVRFVLSETENTNRLTQLYMTHVDQLQGLVSMWQDARQTIEQEQVTEAPVEENHLYHQIMNRLQTGAIYQTLINLRHSTTGDTLQQTEVVSAEQQYLSQHLLLNRLREIAAGTTQPLIYRTENLYEEETREGDTVTEERLRERITSAQLLELIRSVEHAVVLREGTPGDRWLELGDTYYQSADNSISRILLDAREHRSAVTNLAQEMTFIDESQQQEISLLTELFGTEGGIERLLTSVRETASRTSELRETRERSLSQILAERALERQRILERERIYTEAEVSYPEAPEGTEPGTGEETTVLTRIRERMETLTQILTEQHRSLSEEQLRSYAHELETLRQEEHRLRDEGIRRERRIETTEQRREQELTHRRTEEELRRLTERREETGITEREQIHREELAMSLRETEQVMEHLSNEETLRETLDEINRRNVENVRRYEEIRRFLAEQRERPVGRADRERTLRESLRVLDNRERIEELLKEEVQGPENRYERLRERLYDMLPPENAAFFRQLDILREGRPASLVTPEQEMAAAQETVENPPEEGTAGREAPLALTDRAPETPAGQKPAEDVLVERLVTRVLTDTQVTQLLSWYEQLIRRDRIEWMGEHTRQERLLRLEQTPAELELITRTLTQTLEQQEPAETRQLLHDSRTRSAVLSMVHRTEQQQLTEEDVRETLEEYRRELVREQKVVETPVVQHTEIQRPTTQTIQETTQHTIRHQTEDISLLVEQGIRRQLGTISNEVYARLERRLRSEKARRGIT